MSFAYLRKLTAAMARCEVRLVGIAVLLSFVAPGTLGWGIDGHYATCKIAESLLTEDALASVKGLLPDYADGHLSALCSWADQVKFHYRWSSPLHYIDTPDFKCNYDYSRDCHDPQGHKNVCVAGAINNYTMQLFSSRDSVSAASFNLTEALLFLSHFVGDIHQPLHVGFTGDKGGNTIIVHWYKRKSNLHHVWDNMIIESATQTFYDSDIENLVVAIQGNITGSWSNVVSSWKICPSNQTACPNPCASESISAACNYAYKNATPGSVLGDDYFLSRLPVVEKRLAQGGVRLAAILNRIFASKPSSSEIKKTVRGLLNRAHET